MDGGLRKQQANGCLFLSGTKQKPGLEPRKGGAAACSGRKKNEKIVGSPCLKLDWSKEISRM
jgi:hypothetical protein